MDCDILYNLFEWNSNYKIKVQRVKNEKKLAYIKFVLCEKQGTNKVTLVNKHIRSSKVKILFSGGENLWLKHTCE